MNNVQKISSAVILLAVGLVFTTFEEYVPIKGKCISAPEEYAAECGPAAQKKDKRYCIGGKDFICTKPISSGVSRELGGSPW